MKSKEVFTVKKINKTIKIQYNTFMHETLFIIHENVAYFMIGQNYCNGE